MKSVVLIVVTACGGKQPAAPPAPIQNTAHDIARACAPLQPGEASPVIGELPRAAMPLVGTTSDGKRVDVAKLRGKTVLVAFEAPWAHVSEQDDATLPALAKTMGADLEIVRVASAETEADARERVPAGVYKNIVDKPLAGCNIGPTTHAWGVDAVPETFLIDRAGNLRLHFVNWRDWSSPEAIACVRAVAADPMPAIAAPPARAVAATAQTCEDRMVGGAITGTIKLGPGIHGKANTAVFVVAKHPEGGPPVGVEKVIYNGADIPFVLDGRSIMIEGRSLSGKLVVMARYDQDGDALTKLPGDVIGQVTVDAPTTGVVIVLDQVVK